jgi:hypothetical protein
VLNDEAYSRRASGTLEDVLCILGTLVDKSKGPHIHILYIIHISRWHDLEYIGGLRVDYGDTGGEAGDNPLAVVLIGVKEADISS